MSTHVTYAPTLQKEKPNTTIVRKKTGTTETDIARGIDIMIKIKSVSKGTISEEGMPATDSGHKHQAIWLDQA